MFFAVISYVKGTALRDITKWSLLFYKPVLNCFFYNLYTCNLTLWHRNDNITDSKCLSANNTWSFAEQVRSHTAYWLVAYNAHINLSDN